MTAKSSQESYRSFRLRYYLSFVVVILFSLTSGVIAAFVSHQLAFATVISVGGAASFFVVTIYSVEAESRFFDAVVDKFGFTEEVLDEIEKHRTLIKRRHNPFYRPLVFKRNSLQLKTYVRGGEQGRRW